MSKHTSSAVERLPAGSSAQTSDGPTASPVSRDTAVEDAAAGMEKPLRLATGAVFAASLLTYLITLAPTVTGEDSGELVAAAYTLGIPHPPGYPLWCIVTRIFMLIPIGDIAWRANLGSAVCAAAASALIVPLLARLGVRPLVGAGGALLMAFSSTLWRQSVITEVYGLTFLTLVGVLYCLIAWRQEMDTPRGDRWLMATALISALSLGAHNTILLLAPLLAIYVLWVGGRRLLAPVRLGKMALCVLAGLSVQLYLPLRAAANPAMNWGRPDNWERFWAHVARLQYKPVFSDHTVSATFGQLKALGGFLLTQWPWPVTLLVAAGAACGLVSLFRRDRPLASLLTAWALVLSLGFVWLLNFNLDQEGIHVAHVFFIPAWFSLIVLFALGCEAMAGMMAASSRVAVGAAAVVLAIVALVGNFSSSTMHGNDVARRYGSDMLATLPDNAILFTYADYEAFPVAYLQIVEGERKDVIALDQERDILFGHAFEAAGLPRPEGRPDENEVARLLRESKRPIYSTHIIAAVQGTAVQPVGLLYATFSDPKSAREAPALDAEAWKAYPPMSDGPWRKDWSTASMMAAYDIARARSAFAYRRDVSSALASVSSAAERLPGDPVLMHELGVLLSGANQSAAAAEYFERAIALRPDYVPAHVDKINALIRVGRWEEAQEAYARADRTKVPLGEVGRQIEDMLIAEKKARPQLQQMREAAASNPTDPNGWMRLGVAVSEFNRFSEAAQAFRFAVRAAPQDPAPWAYLGMVEAQQGNFDAAIEAWRTFLKIDPKSKQADAIRARLKMLGVKE